MTYTDRWSSCHTTVYMIATLPLLEGTAWQRIVSRQSFKGNICIVSNASGPCKFDGELKKHYHCSFDGCVFATFNRPDAIRHDPTHENKQKLSKLHVHCRFRVAHCDCHAGAKRTFEQFLVPARRRAEAHERSTSGRKVCAWSCFRFAKQV